MRGFSLCEQPIPCCGVQAFMLYNHKIPISVTMMIQHRSRYVNLRRLRSAKKLPEMRNTNKNDVCQMSAFSRKLYAVRMSYISCRLHSIALWIYFSIQLLKMKSSVSAIARITSVSPQAMHFFMIFRIFFWMYSLNLLSFVRRKCSTMNVYLSLCSSGMLVSLDRMIRRPVLIRTIQNWLHDLVLR